MTENVPFFPFRERKSSQTSAFFVEAFLRILGV